MRESLILLNKDSGPFRAREKRMKRDLGQFLYSLFESSPDSGEGLHNHHSEIRLSQNRENSITVT